MPLHDAIFNQAELYRSDIGVPNRVSLPERFDALMIDIGHTGGVCLETRLPIHDGLDAMRRGELAAVADFLVAKLKIEAPAPLNVEGGLFAVTGYRSSLGVFERLRVPREQLDELLCRHMTGDAGCLGAPVEEGEVAIHRSRWYLILQRKWSGVAYSNVPTIPAYAVATTPDGDSAEWVEFVTLLVGGRQVQTVAWSSRDAVSWSP